MGTKTKRRRFFSPFLVLATSHVPGFSPRGKTGDTRLPIQVDITNHQNKASHSDHRLSSYGRFLKLKILSVSLSSMYAHTPCRIGWKPSSALCYDPGEGRGQLLRELKHQSKSKWPWHGWCNIGFETFYTLIFNFVKLKSVY